MNILFLCTANQHRSWTAQDLLIAIDKSNHYKSAGLSRKYVHKAGSTLCTLEMLDWADKIFVFEDAHTKRIQEYTGEKYLSKITNLDIEDNFTFFQRQLVLLILEKCVIDQIQQTILRTK